MRVQISVVVYMFKYPVRTALAVGLSMAQIGEFAFVLLSVASQLGLLPYQVYMLLMGMCPHLQNAAASLADLSMTIAAASLGVQWNSCAPCGCMAGSLRQHDSLEMPDARQCMHCLDIV